MKRLVTQISFDGRIIRRYDSINEASKVVNAPKGTILACCNGKYHQYKGFLWLYSEHEYRISEIIHNIFHPSIPLEWGNEWKDVKGYEDIYKVSEKGIVIAIPRLIKCGNTYKLRSLCKMTPMQNLNGYWCIKLSYQETRERKLLHRIVAEAFIPNPNNFPFVNHKDENINNNTASNLEWCSPSYNVNYGTASLRKSEKLTNGIQSKPVLQFSKEGHLIKEFPSIHEAQRVGFDTSAISKCCMGKYKTHKGYIWKYK